MRNINIYLTYVEISYQAGIRVETLYSNKINILIQIILLKKILLSSSVIFLFEFLVNNLKV